MNQTVLLGRLVNDPIVKELENGKKVSNITIAVNRSFKNEDGIYETDFFNCEIWGNMAQSVSEYCSKGDTISVKGRLQNNIYEDKETHEKKNKITIQVEKVTFISTKDKNVKEEER